MRSSRSRRHARRRIACRVQEFCREAGHGARLTSRSEIMSKKCIISAVVMFVMSWALSFVVHELLLSADYAVTQGMRPPAEVQKLVPFIIAAHAFFGVAFAWIYVQGKEDKPWLMQG